MTSPLVRQVRAGAWVLLPQSVSRLSALVVFALAAQRVPDRHLGVLAVATAITAGSFALAPAIVGKPLAVLGDDRPLREERGQMAQSFALGVAFGLSAVLAAAAAMSEGLLRLALAACAIGVPAAMVVESHYWRTVLVRGRRHSGLVLTAAFLVQPLTMAATVAAGGSDGAVVLSPFAGLALPALALLVVDRDVSWAGGRAWATDHRSTWLPYVAAVAAAVVLVQAIPVVLSLTAGLASASVYRAGELLFGGTNLLIGVVSQTLLTQDTRRVGRAFRLSGAVLVVAAVANGVLLALLPRQLLEQVVGPAAGRLQELLTAFTVQRAALGLATVGSVLLLRVLVARRAGALGVAGAALNLVCLVAGAVVAGIDGALAGLALAEIALAAGYGVLLLRAVRTPSASPSVT